MLIAATTGIGQYTAGQLLKFAGITAEGGITNENAAALADAIGTLQKNINAAKAGTAPVYAIITRTNTVKTILPFKPLQLTVGETVKEFASLNSAVAFAQSLTPVLLPEQEVLNKTVNAETEKLQKKILLLKEELAAEEPSVIIARRPCALLNGLPPKMPNSSALLPIP